MSNEKIVTDRTIVTFLINFAEENEKSIRISIRDGKLRIESEREIQIVPKAANLIIIS